MSFVVCFVIVATQTVYHALSSAAPATQHQCLMPTRNTSLASCSLVHTSLLLYHHNRDTKARIRLTPYVRRDQHEPNCVNAHSENIQRVCKACEQGCNDSRPVHSRTHHNLAETHFVSLFFCVHLSLKFRSDTVGYLFIIFACVDFRVGSTCMLLLMMIVMAAYRNWKISEIQRTDMFRGLCVKCESSEKRTNVQWNGLWFSFIRMRRRQSDHHQKYEIVAR